MANFEDYKIVAKLKNIKEPQTLNKVGPPHENALNLSMPDILRKGPIQGYVAMQFRDLISKVDDVESITYYYKKKKLFTFDYDADEDKLDYLLLRFSMLKN